MEEGLRVRGRCKERIKESSAGAQRNWVGGFGGTRMRRLAVRRGCLGDA